jgi:hypothetical protein
MTRLRRRPRAVYRVYSEEEYLAGVDLAGIDPFANWDAAPLEPVSHPTERCAASTGTSRERRLRRLAGAAALTGAVGTVGGTIALVGLRTHTVDRQVAASALQTRTAPSGVGRSDGSTSSARVALRRDAAHRSDGYRYDRRRNGTHRTPPGGRSTRVARRPRVGPSAGAGTAKIAPSARVFEPESAASEPQPSRGAPAPVASAARDTPAGGEPGPQAQGEFGFER